MVIRDIIDAALSKWSLLLTPCFCYALWVPNLGFRLTLQVLPARSAALTPFLPLISRARVGERQAAQTLFPRHGDSHKASAMTIQLAAVSEASVQLHWWDLQGDLWHNCQLTFILPSAVQLSDWKFCEDPEACHISSAAIITYTPQSGPWHLPGSILQCCSHYSRKPCCAFQKKTSPA